MEIIYNIAKSIEKLLGDQIVRLDIQYNTTVDAAFYTGYLYIGDGVYRISGRGNIDIINDYTL